MRSVGVFNIPHRVVLIVGHTTMTRRVKLVAQAPAFAACGALNIRHVAAVRCLHHKQLDAVVAHVAAAVPPYCSGTVPVLDLLYRVP